MSSLPLPPPLPPPTDPALDSGASSSSGVKKKRAGAPKAKGAVRAKSGCFTCRIRRKKCDERPDADGNCMTCVRLRLECLGFGAKRPDWMRENNSVQELRDKIKQFLASQGMIKGHSGGGATRATLPERDPPVLPLSSETGGGQHNTPPMPPSADPMRRMSHMPVDPMHPDHLVQFLPSGSPFPGPPGQGRPLGPPPPMPHSMVGTGMVLDPALAYMPGYGHPPPPPPPGPPQQQQQPPPQPTSHPMSSIPASPWPSAPPLQPPSSFGASYNINITDDYFNTGSQGRDAAQATTSETMLAVDAPPTPTSTTAATSAMREVVLYRYPQMGDTKELSYVSHYMNHVLKIQYLLAEPSIERFIFNFAHTSPSARTAMCLLSAVHQQRIRQMGQSSGVLEVDNQELTQLLNKTKTLLFRTDRLLTEGEAMAGLHVVSCFLFLGGQGPWQQYLKVAIYWVGSILTDRKYSGPLEAYRNRSESEQFIIRTTMWFDVWSAITQKAEPVFVDIYRQLFNGMHGYPGTQIGDVDMLSVMGCTNETVLAMSETASLAHWKDERLKQGNLSMPALIGRGREIERMYLSREHDAALDDSLDSDDLDTRRRLAANVFRSSARVYLHSVLSGCLPQVDEIAYGVEETIRFLKQIPTSGGASRIVVRSVVLSIALCGCMTDISEHRKWLSSCLVSLAGQEVEVLGNCRQAKSLMERVWERRDGGMYDVDWRDVIKEMTTLPLLLV